MFDAREWDSSADPLEGLSDGIPARVSLIPGRIVEGTRLRIVEWLGDGGMGTVFEAEHVDLEKRVALKVLHSDLSFSAEQTEIFRAEARAAGKVGSPYIVAAQDFVELPDGRLAYVMELVRGRPLRAEVGPGAKEGAMALDRFFGVFRQVCKGLDAAHEQSIVHRDVKPDNIMVIPDRSGPDRVKIMDFGVAAMAGRSSEVAGTPEYMAPEQIWGRGFGPRIDVYALGCTMYEALAGRPPFLGEGLKSVLRQHLKDEPTALSERVTAEVAPAPVAAIVMSCLEKKRKDRPADMRELEAALIEAQIELGVVTAWDDQLDIPDVDPDRRTRLLSGLSGLGRVERRRGWLWPALLGAALIGGLVTLVTVMALNDEEEPTVEAPDSDDVTELSDQARDAAAQAFFVYPPPSEPDRETAYSSVIALEGLHGDRGREVAAELRTEFARTLVRLGDEYWEREGGKSFAVDYYVQALAFDSTDPRASERGAMTVGQLSELRRKAEHLDFSEAELIAAEPLAVFADVDESRRRKKIAALRERDDRRTMTGRAQLERLLAEDAGSKGERGAGVVGSGQPEAGDETSSAEDETGGESSGGPADADAEGGGLGGSEGLDGEPKPDGVQDPDVGGDDPEAESKRDPAAAKAVASDGRAALKRRDYREAERLFHRALGLDRRCAPALIGLSDVHFERGEHAKAVDWAERAVKQAKNNADYRIRLGDAYYKVLRYQDAKREYERAKELGSGQADKRLAKIEDKLGG